VESQAELSSHQKEAEMRSVCKNMYSLIKAN